MRIVNRHKWHEEEANNSHKTRPQIKNTLELGSLRIPALKTIILKRIVEKEPILTQTRNSESKLRHIIKKHAKKVTYKFGDCNELDLSRQFKKLIELTIAKKFEKHLYLKGLWEGFL